MELKQILETKDNITYDIYLTGLNETTIRTISREQQEPVRMLEHRLKCLEILHTLPLPKRWPDLSNLNLDDIVYYAKPHKDYEWYAYTREEVPSELKEKLRSSIRTQRKISKTMNSRSRTKIFSWSRWAIWFT